VKLERVIGLTVSSNAALDCSPETEVVAYPAGYVDNAYSIPVPYLLTYLLHGAEPFLRS